MLTLAVDRSALGHNFFGKLPRSEIFARRYYGRNLDLVLIEQAIRMADIGIMSPLADLAREALRNDLTLSGYVIKRVGMLAACDWDLTPAQGVDEVRAKQFCEQTRKAFNGIADFEQALYDLGWGIWDGRAATEIMWETRMPRADRLEWGSLGVGRPEWYPTELRWLHPGRLSFGPQREIRVVERHRQTSMYYAVGPALQELPGKFIWWLPRYFNDYPEREGNAPRCMYWAFFKRFSWRYRMILTELFGLPWRIIETEKDAPVTPEQLDDSEESAEGMGGTTSIALSPGQKLRIEAPHPESGAFFGMTATEINQEYGHLLLGQSKTTLGDSNRAEGVVLLSEEDRIRGRDGISLQKRIQKQLVVPFIELNHGAEAIPYAPVFTIRTAPPRDRKAELERMRTTVQLGVDIAEAEVYETSGFRKPTNGEAVIRALPQPAAAPGGALGDGGNKGPVAQIAQGSGGTPEDAVGQIMSLLDDDLLEEPESGEQDALGVAAERPRVQLTGTVPPASANGSPELLVERGVRKGQRETSAWADRMVSACAGLTRETALYAALARTADRLPLEQLTREVERRIVHGAALGALDAHYEAEHDTAIKPATFPEPGPAAAAERSQREHELTLLYGADRARELLEREPSPLRLVIGASGGVVDFAAKPFAEAIKDFASKRIVSKRVFERLAASAKKKAFTVAGLARQDMLATAHDELTKAITAGDDLASFGGALASRFEAAGWLPLNPSHVETVFRNAVMGGYARGRDEQMRQPEVLAARPYWQVLGANDDRTRPTHAAAHGKVLAASDPFWQRSPLPWGHNCRCRKVSRSAADLERLGLSLTTGGELQGLPDKGWDAESL